jgi:hypothetical protein
MGKNSGGDGGRSHVNLFSSHCNSVIINIVKCIRRHTPSLCKYTGHNTIFMHKNA